MANQIESLYLVHGKRAYKNIYYDILWENRTDEAFSTFIKIIQLDPDDEMIGILINRIIRWNIFADKYDTVIRSLNNLMSPNASKHWGIFNVVMDILDTPINRQLCIELLSHHSVLALTKVFSTGPVDIRISPVMHWYKRHSVKYMINFGKFYSSIVMHVYADRIYDSIFKYWTMYRQFRHCFHALVLYICKNMTPGIMAQINQHRSDFVEMIILNARYASRRSEKIFILLITYGLDIFSRCYSDKSLYDVIKISGSTRLKEFIAQFFIELSLFKQIESMGT